ncbi:MAG TPA: tetratricopeptide repeat protein [Anaerohalosphaeraceae bacterium]|nr:tetratricopeptide repeat protein [Anaerohalosphaeraceae bacterium]HOT74049.1 tetratricopeptide repeat protein [Anaerohalosphaeraceae bacterium]HPB94083.1 tetratricopeptide repeat protein [Anaerohalosphaeraceae bacterium]HQG07048.1 tetratricopeptide repeat protein [Anaerohalosphaeraceae bacterium]HQI08632.1 tetratricopeptide repeat protein [Anaerohalosphaeraceae bacterium]
MQFIGGKTIRGRKFVFATVCLLCCVSFLFAKKKEDPFSIDRLCREYRKAGRSEEAFALYQQGLQTPAGADSVLLRQGIIEMLIEKGESAEAEEQVEILFSNYSGQADEFTRAIYPILNRYLQRKEYAKAVEIGRRALQLYPEHGNAFSTRAVMAEALVWMKEVDQADALVEEMFALYRERKDFVPFLHKVKSAYWKADQKDKSQVLCLRLLAEFPEHPLATRILGDWICGALILEQNEERIEGAIESLYSRPEPAEDFLAVAARIQERYLARNDFSRVLSLGNRALQLYPDRPEGIFVYRWLAEASAGIGDAKQACQWADALAAKFGSHPDIGQILVEVGHDCRRHGLYPQSLRVYQQALISRNCPRKDRLCVLAGMAQAYIEMGDDTKVNEIATMIFTNYREEEKIGYSLFVIGEKYYLRADKAWMSGNKQQAKEDFQKAIDLWQKNLLISEDVEHQGHALYYTGIAYWKSGDPERAMQYFLRLSADQPNYKYIYDALQKCGDCCCILYQQHRLDIEDTRGILEYVIASLSASSNPSMWNKDWGGTLGEIYYKLGQWERAVKYLEVFINEPPAPIERSEASFQLAEAYAKAGNKEAALTYYVKYLDQIGGKDAKRMAEVQSKIVRLKHDIYED